MSKTWEGSLHLLGSKAKVGSLTEHGANPAVGKAYPLNNFAVKLRVRFGVVTELVILVATKAP